MQRVTFWNRSICLTLAAAFSALALAASAQTPTTIAVPAARTPATQARGEANGAAAGSAGAGVERITLGQSVVPLYGPWRFSVGDSPVDPATHRRLWAQPDFDDSHWETVDLKPKDGSYDPINGISGFVPGWTSLGHPGYSGFAWYRLRIDVRGADAGKLALAAPADLDDGFQVFSEGRPLGSFGDFTKSHPVVYPTQPTFFALPNATEKTGPEARTTDRVRSATGTEEIRTIAFRFWMEPSTPLNQPDAGGLHGPPLLGQAGAIAARYQVSRFALFRAYAVGLSEPPLFVLLAILAFSLSIFDRSDRVYYWISGVYLLSAINGVVFSVSALSETIGVVLYVILVDALFLPLILAVWVMVWWVWFQLERPAWLPRIVVVLTVLFSVGNILGEEIVFGLVPHPVAPWFHLLSAAVRLGFLGLLVLIVVLGVRVQGREGWIALPAVLLLGVSRFQLEFAVLHIRTAFFPFGIRVSMGDISQFLLMIALFLLLLRRVLRSVQLQREQALDIKQAVEVQQVILPEASAVYGSFTVETEYRAAREVGGDFFQMIPNAIDGSLLVVAGDVTGKGLQAGMLVALLVGAIRATAEVNPEPLSLLESLNRRLIGRRSAQATCLALRVAADGEVTLANAGHIPPYLNGTPLAMEGALPLGMIEAAEFSVMRFPLAKKDTLLVLSDGILEATNAKGELFGFDRIATMLAKGATIQALADAAEGFGQVDDISIVAVRRD